MTTDARRRFVLAIARFDEVHATDARAAGAAEGGETWSLLYHRRLSSWVERLAPDAPEALRLAAGCQHIRRWAIPRDQFPTGPTGYKRWRSTLAQFHAAEAAGLLREVGYGDETVARVRDLLIKRGLRRDPEVQLFEDAICLTFIENEFASFSVKHDERKLIDIVRKTWAKMSDHGHELALELAARLPESARKLLHKALSP